MPSVADKAIHQCVNGNRTFKDRSRSDFLFNLPGSDYDDLVECDEREHVGLTPLCEMSRLHTIQESLRALLQADTRKLIVIRFKADASDADHLMKTLWTALIQVISVGVEWGGDVDHPVWLHALIGYSDRRIRKYKYQGITFNEQKVFVVLYEIPDMEPITKEFWDQTNYVTNTLQQVSKIIFS